MQRSLSTSVSISVNDKGQAVITRETTLVEYCAERAQTLRAMMQVLGDASGEGDPPRAAPAYLARPLPGPLLGPLMHPLLRLMHEHVNELEPLFRALDQRAYEKGFEDGRTLGLTRAERRAEPVRLNERKG
jgi:hypothetical protein